MPKFYLKRMYMPKLLIGERTEKYHFLFQGYRSPERLFTHQLEKPILTYNDWLNIILHTEHNIINQFDKSVSTGDFIDIINGSKHLPNWLSQQFVLPEYVIEYRKQNSWLSNGFDFVDFDISLD